MSMTIYGSPLYATIKEIPEMESMSAVKLYDYISKNAGWKSTEGTYYDGICLDSSQSWIQFLNDKDELVAFDVWYEDTENRYVAQTIELSESETSRQRAYLLYLKLKKEYHEQSEVCMSEFLAQRTLTCDIELAFQLYVKLMKWAEKDEFYRINKDEKWIERCTEDGINTDLSDELLENLDNIHNKKI